MSKGVRKIGEAMFSVLGIVSSTEGDDDNEVDHLPAFENFGRGRRSEWKYTWICKSSVTRLLPRGRHCSDGSKS